MILLWKQWMILQGWLKTLLESASPSLTARYATPFFASTHIFLRREREKGGRNTCRCVRCVFDSFFTLVHFSMTLENEYIWDSWLAVYNAWISGTPNTESPMFKLFFSFPSCPSWIGRAQLRSADGVPDGQLTLADINGFSQLLVNPSVCPEGFTEEAATTPQGQACSLDPWGAKKTTCCYHVVNKLKRRKQWYRLQRSTIISSFVYVCIIGRIGLFPLFSFISTSFSYVLPPTHRNLDIVVTVVLRLVLTQLCRNRIFDLSRNAGMHIVNTATICLVYRHSVSKFWKCTIIFKSRNLFIFLLGRRIFTRPCIQSTAIQEESSRRKYPGYQW